MKYHLQCNVNLSLFLIFFSCNIIAWEKDEHQLLADLVFDSTLSYCEIEFTDALIYIPGKVCTIEMSKKLLNGNSFGNISALFSGDDLSQSRCHMKGYTILKQLQTLSKSIIDKAWNRINSSPDDIQSLEVSNQNVVFNYLLYHIIALRFAELSAKEIEGDNKFIRYALIYEAVAQSYLSDAFSSGHFFLQVSDFVAQLNRMNIKISHEYYSFEGAFVIDSQGNSWQAFGDNLLQWYPTSFKRVFEACLISLRELFLVYYSSLKNIEMPRHLREWAKLNADGKSLEELSDSWVTTYNGAEYYSEVRMPSLLCIPMPLAASWSVRTEIKDKDGFYKRKHYPQLSNEKYHDPDLDDIDKEFLYPRSAMPNWMIPEFLPNDTLKNLIKYHPDIASVRYRQDRFIPPSYRGYLLIVGGTYVYSNDQNDFAASLGLGWGFTDEFLFILIKPSIFVTAMHSLGTSGRWVLSADFGVGVNTSILGIFKPHFEVGYANGFESPNNGSAGKFALGLDSKTLPLGFTYAGLTFRLKYQVITFIEALHSPVLEIILH